MFTRKGNLLYYLGFVKHINKYDKLCLLETLVNYKNELKRPEMYSFK